MSTLGKAVGFCILALLASLLVWGYLFGVSYSEKSVAYSHIDKVIGEHFLLDASSYMEYETEGLGKLIIYMAQSDLDQMKYGNTFPNRKELGRELEEKWREYGPKLGTVEVRQLQTGTVFIKTDMF